MNISHSEPFLLSGRGSTRASAYTFSNKSITLDDKTHVVWLDAVAEVKGRTFDHQSRIWSDTFDIGTGQDNHTTPAITADAEGYIRISYGPHARGWNDGRFKYALSARPNDISEWNIPKANIANFGYQATYSCLMHLPQGRDAIVYRGGEYPLSTMFQYTREEGGWIPARALFRQAIEPQYTHYGSIMTADEKGTVYVGSHFYNVGMDQPPVRGDRSLMRSHGVALIRTSDLGETWTAMDGTSVSTPSLYSEAVAVPPLNGNVRIIGLALDADSQPVLLTGSPRMDLPELLLTSWNGKTWESEDLASELPAGRICTGGSMTIDTAGRIHAAIMAVEQEACGDCDPDRVWGHPSTEVFHLIRDGKETICTQISASDPGTASWLPNISRQELFAPVDDPVILYTHGVKGEGCSPLDENEIYCVLTKMK